MRMPFAQRIMRRIAEPIVVPAFHYLWYSAPNTWRKNTFLGYEILQNPFDMQVYQELMYSLKPAFVVQTGVAGGGSIVYFASLLDLMRAPETARVVGIDIALTAAAKAISHPRVRLYEGNSIATELVHEVRQKLPEGHGMVILDSDHNKQHVLAELRLYKGLISIGSYLVVEDTNVNGHPVFPSFGPGPFEAVQEFLQENRNFIIDEKLGKRNMFSFHHWLCRIC